MSKAPQDHLGQQFRGTRSSARLCRIFRCVFTGIYQLEYELISSQAAKSAQRSLADTMRLEATRYSGPVSTYTVQCVNFITPTFLEEQKNKPELTKRLEGTTGGLKELEKQFPYAEKIASEIVAAVASEDFAVMDKRMDLQLLWANMIGPSPRRGLGIVDALLTILMSFFLFPFVRRGWDKTCKGDALRK